MRVRGPSEGEAIVLRDRRDLAQHRLALRRALRGERGETNERNDDRSTVLCASQQRTPLHRASNERDRSGDFDRRCVGDSPADAESRQDALHDRRARRKRTLQARVIFRKQCDDCRRGRDVEARRAKSTDNGNHIGVRLLPPREHDEQT